MMITYQLITALSDAKPQSHLIARLLYAFAETALIAEMRESASIADTRFGCAPFARITLLPDALWHDSLTEGLLTALRPLLASPVSPE
jgi:leucyl aminopeptidase